MEHPIRVEMLLARCQALMSELEAFRDFVAESKQSRNPALRSISNQAVDLQQFYAPVATELKSLQKVGPFEGDLYGPVSS